MIHRKFTPLDILNRACEHGIRISLQGDDLEIDIPARLEQATKNKALEVIKAHKAEIVEYLHSLEKGALCYTCLEEDIVTECDLVGPDGLMYCQDHYRALKRAETSLKRWDAFH